MYELVSVVVHCGLGPNRGHYICIVKTLGDWLLFDDDVVEVGCCGVSTAVCCACLVNRILL